MIQVDRGGWSGDGDLTAALLEKLASIEQVGFVRVEDAPASRAGAPFNFICNEIYVAFRIQRTIGLRRVLGILPLPAILLRKSLTLAGLEQQLAATAGIGAPDYADATMLQYLRSERVVAAYQTRGPKLVEMIRIYEVPGGRPGCPDLHVISRSDLQIRTGSADTLDHGSICVSTQPKQRRAGRGKGRLRKVTADGEPGRAGSRHSE
jgi:hypothetical protein